MVPTLKPGDRARLRQFLEKRFSLEKLEALAFDLGVNYQALPHKTTTEFAVALIRYFEHRGNLNCLLAEVMRQRYDYTLAQLSAQLPIGSAHTKVQINIDQDILEDPSEIVADLAAKLKIDVDQVELIGAALGSSRLLVGLPREATDVLLKSEIHGLVNGKYQIIAVIAFDSLNTACQKTWRLLVARHVSWPPISWSSIAQPDIGESLPERLRRILNRVWMKKNILTNRVSYIAIPLLTIVIILAGALAYSSYQWRQSQVQTKVLDQKEKYPTLATLVPTPTHTPVATTTPIPSRTPIFTITPTPLSPTDTSTPNSTATPTAIPTATSMPVAIRAISPAYSIICRNPVTFRWTGPLQLYQMYRVRVRYNAPETGMVNFPQSERLTEPVWQAQLLETVSAGGRNYRVYGEIEWQVLISDTRSGETVSSSPWFRFYFDTLNGQRCP